jgi:hypothetical protein
MDGKRKSFVKFLSRRGGNVLQQSHGRMRDVVPSQPSGFAASPWPRVLRALSTARAAIRSAANCLGLCSLLLFGF